MYNVYVYVHVHVYDIWERTGMALCNMSNSNHVNKCIKQGSRQHLLWLAIFSDSLEGLLLLAAVKENKGHLKN